MKYTGNQTSRLYFLVIFVKYFTDVQMCKSILSSMKNDLYFTFYPLTSLQLSAACYAIPLLSAGSYKKS